MNFDHLVPKENKPVEKKETTGMSFDHLVPQGNEAASIADTLLNKTPVGKLAQRTLKRGILKDPINERQIEMVKHRGRGFKQMIMKAAKEKGLVSQEDFDSYTSSALDKREAFEKDFLDRYGESEFWDQVDFETDIGTSMMLPAAGGKSRIARILFGTLAGGAENASRLSEDESEIFEQFKEGALFGGGGAGAIEILDSLRPTQLAKRAFQEYQDSDVDGKAKSIWNKAKKTLVKPGVVDEGRKAEQLIGQHLTASEITQDPFLQALESFVRHDPGVEAQARNLNNKQMARAVKWFKDKANKLDPQGKHFATQMQADFSATTKNLVNIRKLRAKKDFAKAFDANPTPSIDTRDIKNYINEQIAELSQPGVAVGKKLTQLNQLKKMQVALPDKITAKHAQSLYETWSPSKSAESKIFKELDTASEKRILNTLTARLDDSVQSTGDQLLIKARDNYRLNSQPIEELKNSAVGKLFGKTDPKPEEIIKAFDRMDTTDINAAVKLLGDKDPQIVNRLKAFKINQALDSGVSKQDPGSFQYDLGAFHNKLKDKTFKSVFTGKERSDLLKGLNYANRVDKSVRKMASDQQLEVGGGFVNKTILSKMVSKFVGAKALGDLLTTPQGLEKLKIAANAPNSVALAASITDLMEYSDASVNKLLEDI